MYRVRVKKEFKKSVKRIIKNVNKSINLPLKNKNKRLELIVDFMKISRGFWRRQDLRREL